MQSSRSNDPKLPKYETILTSTPNPGLLLILLNRPKALNSITPTLISELSRALKWANENPELYGAVVIGSTSKEVFCAGANIKELIGQSQEAMILNQYRYELSRLYDDIDIPVIAAVSGLCIGGGLEIALICDIVYCSENTSFALPEIKLGIFPGGGGTQRLPGIIGKSRAMELILTGERFGAEDAEKWGVVSKVIEEGDNQSSVLNEAVKLGARLAKGPRLALRMAKRATCGSYEMPLKEGIQREKTLMNGLFGKPEQMEGMRAFIEKRKTNFNKL